MEAVGEVIEAIIPVGMEAVGEIFGAIINEDKGFRVSLYLNLIVALYLHKVCIGAVQPAELLTFAAP